MSNATDRSARPLERKRSAFVRPGMRDHLRALRAREREEADRSGYQRMAESTAELAGWDRVPSWPSD